MAYKRFLIFFLMSGLAMACGLRSNNSGLAVDERPQITSLLDLGGSCFETIQQISKGKHTIDKQSIAKNCFNIPMDISQTDIATIMTSTSQLNENSVRIALIAIAWQAIESAQIGGIVITRDLTIDSPVLILSGYLLVLHNANITCTTCDFKNAEIVSSGKWTVNGKACQVENSKLVCP